MDMMQLDWEPLSHCELEQRLDQAVEEILEAELMSGVQGRSETIPQAGTLDVTCEGEAEGEPASEEKHEHVAEMENPPEVQYITSLLQKLNWSHSERRLKGRSSLSLSHTVFLSLTLLSSRLSYRSVSSTFRLEKGNVHRIFFSFCHRVNTLQDRIIRWPSGLEASDLLLPFSSRLVWNEKLEQNGLPKVLGVLGHTHIPIRLNAITPDSENDAPDAKRLRKCSHRDSWLNLELVCDAEGRFIHCSISPGSQRSRGEALSQKLAQHPELLPPGTCLLARTGYPLTRNILTPFRTTRNQQENLYNREVETHLRRLEQAVADLKERFRRLCYLDTGTCERGGAVVQTCCILHTALLQSGYVTKSQVENRTEEEEEEEEGMKEEAGVKLRETVANLLYSTLE